jgi:hypothetical protein
MNASENLALRDGRLDTAMRSIWGGQACCSALPHRRAAPHRVARAPQGAAQRATRHIEWIGEERASTRRSDSPVEQICRGNYNG